MFYLLLVLLILLGLNKSIINDKESEWFDEIPEFDLAHPDYYISEDKSEYIKEYCARTETFMDKEFCKSHSFSKCQ